MFLLLYTDDAFTDVTQENYFRIKDQNVTFVPDGKRGTKELAYFRSGQYVLSHEEKKGVEHGFVTAYLIRKYAPDTSYFIFLCGLQQMYAFVDKELEKMPERVCLN